MRARRARRMIIWRFMDIGDVGVRGRGGVGVGDDQYPTITIAFGLISGAKMSIRGVWIREVRFAIESVRVLAG